MKKIYNLLLLTAAMTLSLTGCSEDDPFTTAGPDDTPRFLAPSSIEGNRETSMSLNRDETFKMDVVVTPVNYSTIEWVSDGHVLGTGSSFSKQFEAGNYEIDINVKTQAGKQAHRKVKLLVRALDGDPEMKSKEKNRWLNPGEAFTIEGSNLAGVSSLAFVQVADENTTVVDGKETVVACTAAEDGNSVTVTLPAGMTLGTYRVSAIKSETERFGCGLVKVTDEKYVDPGVKETVLWEGATDINWGASNVLITPEQMAAVPVGATIQLFYEMVDMPDNYHAMRITTNQWGDNPEDQVVAQFDLTGETPNPFEFTYSAANKEIVDSREGMLIVGYGYRLTKVVALEGSAPAETDLWEGATDINWGASNVLITPEQMAAVPVGATINVYYEMVDMPDNYHAMRITTNQWGDNPEDQVVAQFDLTGETPNPFSFTYSAANKEIVDSREGMLIVGYGYRLTRVSFEQ